MHKSTAIPTVGEARTAGPHLAYPDSTLAVFHRAASDRALHRGRSSDRRRQSDFEDRRVIRFDGTAEGRVALVDRRKSAACGRIALTGNSITNVTLWDVSHGGRIPHDLSRMTWFILLLSGPTVGIYCTPVLPRPYLLSIVAEGEIIRRFGKGAHSAQINSVVFAPDGRTAPDHRQLLTTRH